MSARTGVFAGTGRSQWIAGALVTGVLLAVVATRIDGAALSEMPARIARGPLLLAFALLLGESGFAALRLHVLAGPRRDGWASYEVTAWHALWLLALPARLGDVVWVLLLRNRYAWRGGVALACALFQRLLDLGVVLLFVALGLPAVAGLPGRDLWLAGAAVLGAGVAASVLAFDRWTGWLATWLRRDGRPPPGLRRRAFRSLVLGRAWWRRLRGGGIRVLALGLSVAAAACIAGAYLCVLRALGIAATPAEAVFLMGATQLVVALPIQSVGGLGVFEAGLAGLLALLGSDASDAALAALLVRAVSLCAMFAFWLPVGVRALARRRWATPEAGAGPT